MSEQSQSVSLADLLNLMGQQQSKAAPAPTVQVLGGTMKENKIAIRVSFNDYTKDPKRIVYKDGRPQTIYAELPLGGIAESLMKYLGIDPDTVDWWVGKTKTLTISNKRDGVSGGETEILNV